MVTSIEQMRASAVREAVLSGWDGDEITVKLKRPGLLAMAQAGRIPNPLLKTADALFMRNGSAIKDANLEDMAKTMTLIAKEALIEPTLDELTQAGLTLTDQQMNEIYAFALGGVAALDRFRGGLRDSDGGRGHDDELQGERAAGH